MADTTREDFCHKDAEEVDHAIQRLYSAITLMPYISARRLIRALEKLGCTVDRQKGSHATIINDAKRTTTIVAVHPGEMSKNHIKTILKQIDVSE